MKRFILFTLTFLPLGVMYAQVGIKTDAPQGVFHVDSKGDTNGSLNISDDVIVTSNGNVGIGTLTPGEKLHVVGQSLTTGNSEVGNTVFIGGNGLIKGKVSVNGTHTPEASVHVKNDSYSMKIESTSYESGKFITSDADGYADWEKLLADSEVMGLNVPMYSTAKSINNTSSNYVNITDIPLVLSKGVWLIIARYGTRSSTTTSGTVSNLLWTKLEMNEGAGWTEVITNATLTETGQSSVGSANRWRTAVPQLTQIMNVEKDNTNIRISAYLNTTLSYVTVTTTETTSSYFPGFMPVFVAIRLNNKPI